MANRPLLDALALIVRSKGYALTVFGTDDRKVRAELAGDRRERARGYLARGLQDAARIAWAEPEPPPPPPPPPPPAGRYAPRTHNVGAQNQDPRFCCRPEYGVRWDDARAVFVDERGATYNRDGMLLEGRDRARIVPGLKGAESMDGLEPCDPYSYGGRSFPPYPTESYER